MPAAQFQYGPLFLTTFGWNPQSIEGPQIDSHVVEHLIPGREGGIVEYLGSRQPSYTIRGFIAPREIMTDNASQIVSGRLYVTIQADELKQHFRDLRGSGAQLLRIESTFTSFSGYQSWYENDFFLIRQAHFLYEAGRGYPYYPYTMVLHRASPLTYGNSSGIATYNPTGTYFSGYIRVSSLRSGAWPIGETINTLGFYAQSVASGNAKMAVYPYFGGAGALTLQAQSTTQAVHSGWNYFPIRPSFVTTSGTRYEIAIKSDADGIGAWQLQTTNSNMGVSDPNPQCSGAESYTSGVSYGTAFPDPYVLGTFVQVSGNVFRTVMVTA